MFVREFVLNSLLFRSFVVLLSGGFFPLDAEDVFAGSDACRELDLETAIHRVANHSALVDAQLGGGFATAESLSFVIGGRHIRHGSCR